MLHFGVKKVWTSSFLTFWESEDKLVEPFNQLVSFLEEVDILWENGSNWSNDDQWKQYYTETSQLFFSANQLSGFYMMGTLTVTDFKGKSPHYLLINPFVPNAHFLYPLKTSENLTVERVRWEQMG